MKEHEIAETIDISKGCVGYILHEKLDMKKFCARWVPACSQLIEDALAWKSLNSVWSILTKIQLILFISLLLWMRLGFTIIHQNPNSSQNSGQKAVVQCHKNKYDSISRKGHGIGVLRC
jgi:hypothetical protein